MTSEMIFVPETKDEATTELESAAGVSLPALSRDKFLRVWNSIAYLNPGLHPDHHDEQDGGWTDELRLFAVEAFRRADAGDISEDEIYPSDAQWCGLCDEMNSHTDEERSRRERLAVQSRLFRQNWSQN